MPAEPTTRSWRETFSIYLHPRVVVMLFLGFSAGLPFLLIFSTSAGKLLWMNVLIFMVGAR